MAALGHVSNIHETDGSAAAAAAADASVYLLRYICGPFHGYPQATVKGLTAQRGRDRDAEGALRERESIYISALNNTAFRLPNTCDYRLVIISSLIAISWMPESSRLPSLSRQLAPTVIVGSLVTHRQTGHRYVYR